jgi:hypothetical protein
MTIRQRQRIASTRKLRAGGCQQFASELAYLFAPFVSLGLPIRGPILFAGEPAHRAQRWSRSVRQDDEERRGDGGDRGGRR